MKRFHVHVAVDDLNQSMAFYSALFGQAPAVAKPDYAKWMLEDPRLNFAISTHGDKAGVNHLGFQVEDEAELQALQERLHRASSRIVEEMGKDCCYAKSDKYWVTDPSGLAWESFRTLQSVPVYGDRSVEIDNIADAKDKPKEAAACCAPTCCA